MTTPAAPLDPSPSKEGRPNVVNEHGALLWGPFPPNYRLDVYKWETDFLLLQTCPLPEWIREGNAKPPPQHPNRCQGKKRKHFPAQQCKKVALRGKYFCQFHMGRMANSPTRTFDNVMSIYSKKASPQLKELLEQVKTAERRSLDDEIDMARAMTDRSVRIFEAACITKADSTPAHIKVMAIQNLREAITLVTETAYKSSKIRIQEEEVMDAEQLKMFVEMVTTLIEQCVTSERDKIALINGLRDMRMPRSKDRLSPEEFAEQSRLAMERMSRSVPSHRSDGPDEAPLLALEEPREVTPEEPTDGQSPQG